MNQEDSDSDLLGDVCDECTDTDQDGYGNPEYLVNTCPDDNCPNIPNSTQEDSYPPSGNGIGDVCECEGNLDCDQDCDGTDAATFKADFGRSTFQRPCTHQDTCNGDFSCDGDVDGTDAALFKSDFGRSTFSNPCPVCISGVEWCQYP